VIGLFELLGANDVAHLLADRAAPILFDGTLVRVLED
jgi:hypothetical protein